MLVERAKNIKLGDPHHEETRMGAMIHQVQADKVMQYIESAKIEVNVLYVLLRWNDLIVIGERPSIKTLTSYIFQGAEILVGGNYREMDGILNGGRYIEPTIIGMINYYDSKYVKL